MAKHRLPISFREAKLFQDFKTSGVTMEDLARGWASINGQLDEFDEGKKDPASDEKGYYLGYICEMESIFERAIKYAKERPEKKGR